MAEETRRQFVKQIGMASALAAGGFLNLNSRALGANDKVILGLLGGRNQGRGDALRAIGAGANGYITKRSAPEQLVNAIRKVHAGGRYLSDSAAESLAQHMATGPRSRTPLDTLSNREIQVLRHLALGHTVREIAQAYHLSTNTVHTYRLRLLRKLNLRNNAEISLFAIQNRLVEL